MSAGNDANDLDHEIIYNDNDTPTDPADDFYEHLPSFYATYCNSPTVSCVAATGPTQGFFSQGTYTFTGVNEPAPYTNFGRSAISVAAPGGNGSNTVATRRRAWVYAACSQTSLVIPVCQTGNYFLGINGTSMAAPHASGVAAILVSNLGHDKPGMIRAALQRTAVDILQPGVDPYSGKGLVNAYNAATIK